MFKLMQSPAYWWPVTLQQPAEDKPGELVATTFEVQFLRKTAAEQQAWLDEVRTKTLSDAQYVRPLVAGFRQVFDAVDQAVAFTPSALEQLLNVPGAASAMTRAYFESNGQAAQKN